MAEVVGSHCQVADHPPSGSDQGRDEGGTAGTPSTDSEAPAFGSHGPLPPLLYGGKAKVFLKSLPTRRSLLSHGLRVVVRCPAACSVYAELALDARGKRARTTRPAVLARRSAAFAAGGEQKMELTLAGNVRTLLRAGRATPLLLRVRILPRKWPGARYDKRLELRG